ncbi:MAG TPA: hypothetical protein VFG73_07310 [Rhodanobacteraceae bacterium]|nr:hypothetical protein [Rhodanobacteraceae bacterium]
MTLLPLLLLAPTMAVLAALYWFFPRSLPGHAGRRLFDLVAVLAAAAVTLVLGRAGDADVVTGAVGTHSGAIWPQVLAVLLTYAGFCAVLLAALVARHALWGRHPR